ncbi:MAG: phosphonate ABC transporter ATP-binding protein [Planctomycetota bacterium]
MTIAPAATASADTDETSQGLPALRVHDLAKSYDQGRVSVFHGVDFQVPDGQRVALIGANGAGKSTLLRCCLRLIEPDRGAVWIGDCRITDCSRSQLRRQRAHIGVVFQRHQLVPQLSVLTNVLHGSLCRGSGPRHWFHGLARRGERVWALHCLEQVGLADLADKPVRQCSGGQSQRVAIARALMQRPRLLFADEPAASLDPQAGREVMRLFSDLARESGLTMVFVSHHLEHAVRYADRVIGLRDGVLALDRSTAGLQARELEGMYG